MLEAAKWYVSAYNLFIMKLGTYSVGIHDFSMHRIFVIKHSTRLSQSAFPLTFGFRGHGLFLEMAFPKTLQVNLKDNSKPGPSHNLLSKPDTIQSQSGMLVIIIVGQED